MKFSKVSALFCLIILCAAARIEGSECEDKELTCILLIASMPRFCKIPEHAFYAKTNCQRSCGFCKAKPINFEHNMNLIWAQTPHVKGFAVSRLVAIPGDPSVWVANGLPKATYISAPHFAWEFKALGFHWADETLFWSESTNKKIQSLVLNGSTGTRVLFSGTSPAVYGIAVDWLSRNLYFTDALYNWIMMTSSRPDRSSYRIVVQDKLDAPHGVAVHPKLGYLIWSDWGERPKIEISNLLGQNRRPLVERDLVKPHGLTIDYTEGSVYWLDSFKATIEVIQLNGQSRRLIQKVEGTDFYGIALFKNFLFVTERSRGMLRVFDQGEPAVGFHLGNDPHDVLMYDGSRQPGNSTECEDLGCEHMCVLDPETGPKCLCGEGYESGDDLSTTCVVSMTFVQPSHIYAIRDSICQYPANIADMSLFNVTLDSQCFLDDRLGYLTLTYDARENMLYYFGNNTRTINRIPLKMGGKTSVLTGATGVVKGLALDWVSGNLYWTDSTNGKISVSRKSGTYQRVILEKLNNPVGIAVHPGLGKIYWTDHGHLPDIGGKVEQANLDGTGREAIIEDNVGQPNHLYIDFDTNRVYWSDSILHHVRVLDIKTGRITVAFEKADTEFYGLTFFKDFILWTDTHEKRNGIHVARMDTKEKHRGIIHPLNGLAQDLVTFDIHNQPMFNSSCVEGKNKCSQLCLLTAANMSKCWCGVGYDLSTDGFTCISAPVTDEFLLVSDAYQKQIYQVNLQNAAVRAVPLTPLHQPIALAYDPMDMRVFWSDNKANLIKEARIDGIYEKTVLLMNEESMCDGLVADYVNKLLFYTDTGNDLIGVIAMRNYDLHAPIITEDLEEPRDIIVSPKAGLIFWSDWGSRPRIESANMDGSDRATLVTFDSLAWVNGLALDHKDNTLFWIDAHSNTISCMNLTTGEVINLLQEPNAHYFSVEVMGDFLYVTDWKKTHLRRMNKRGGQLKKYGPSTFTTLYDIKGFNSSEAFKGLSVCVSSVCEQLCLPKKDKQYTCKCAVGFVERGPECQRAPFNLTVSPANITLLPPPTATLSPSPTRTVVYNTTATRTDLPSSPNMSSLGTSSVSPWPTRTPTATGEIRTSTRATSKGADSSSSPNLSSPGTSGISPQTTGSPRTISPGTITKMPVTMMMTTAMTGDGGSGYSSSVSTDPNDVTTTVIPSGKSVTGNPRGNGASEVTGVPSTLSANSGISTFVIVAIITGVIIFLAVIIAGVIIVRRRKGYTIRHSKLEEDRSPVDFYKIAFTANGEDQLNFDTGIENPTFGCLHDPSSRTPSTLSYPPGSFE